MAGSKTSEFPASGESPDANDLIAFVDVSQGTNETMTVSQLAAADSFASLAGGGGGSGTVDTSGIPVLNDFARFTDADTIEGRSYAEVRTDLGLVIGTNVQAHSAVLDATTASFTTAEASKLAGIEAAATADQSASEILTAVKTVDGTGSGLDADLLDGNEATAFATATGLSDHIADTADAHDASAISLLDAGGKFTATDVEAALAEVKDIADSAAGGGTTLEQVQDDLGNTSLIAGTSLTKVYDDVANTITLNVDAADFATASGLSDHIADTVDAHDASAISVLDTGTLYTATDVEAALAEVKTIADAAVTPGEAAAAYQPLATVLTNTTASYTTAEASKLAGIEALADVTDTTNVTAAGALMDSEVDADIKTLALPANTTISTFGASLVDDADNTAARTTLGLGTMATATAADYLPLVAAGASVENIGAIEENVHVASVVTTQAFDAAVYGRAVYTMTGNTTFSITNPAPSGKATTFVMRIKGAFTPTLPASFNFPGTPPAYVGTGEGTTYVGTTEDGGVTYQVTVLAGWA